MLKVNTSLLGTIIRDKSLKQGHGGVNDSGTNLRVVVLNSDVNNHTFLVYFAFNLWIERLCYSRLFLGQTTRVDVFFSISWLILITLEKAGNGTDNATPPGTALPFKQIVVIGEFFTILPCDLNFEQGGLEIYRWHQVGIEVGEYSFRPAAVAQTCSQLHTKAAGQRSQGYSRRGSVSKFRTEFYFTDIIAGDRQREKNCQSKGYW